MTESQGKPASEKISDEFAGRLGRLGPEDVVRAVVLLYTKPASKSPGRRQNASERRAAIEAVRKGCEEALGAVDQVLARFGGQRLASGADVLGSMPVETTAAGIQGLAALDRVKSIIEDQEIRPLM